MKTKTHPWRIPAVLAALFTAGILCSLGPGLLRPVGALLAAAPLATALFVSIQASKPKA